jgi:hypothetical protein
VRRAAGLLAVAAVLAGCGDDGDDRAAAPTPTPTPTATAMPSPVEEPTATAPSAPAPPPDGGVDEGHEVQDARKRGEDQEGGGGDEEAARTPVRVVVDGEGITPPSVAVPAFIALRVTVRNDLPRAIRVRIGRERRVTVRARERRAIDAGGLRPGRHAIDAGVAGRGVIVAR